MTHCKSNMSLPMVPTTSKHHLPPLSPCPVTNSLPPSPAKDPKWEPAEEPPKHHRINWDKHSTMIFPVLAISFNCVYWVFYLYLDKK